jgi:cytochrome c oxidase cbb3-type subunit III
MSSRCPEARAEVRVAVVAIALVMLSACAQPDVPAERQAPPGGDRMDGVRQVTLRPGGVTTPLTTSVNPLGSGPQVIKEGQRLYNWMNCGGCHFEGGGGIGPPLMDDDWIYGGSPAQIFDSIVNGRANGMPAYGDRLAADEVWRIVAFVETLNPDRESGDGSSSPPRDEGGAGGR